MNPDRFTNQELFLEVSGNHQIYVHDWGNIKAEKTVVYLHGGPGIGCNDRDKKKFNPSNQRVIFIDQRGSGRSLPLGETKLNTTEDLVKDIYTAIDHLNLKKAILVGGSWGSTLALCFALAHPKKVDSIIIDGVFTGSEEEIDWLDKGKWQTFFPDLWERYRKSVPTAYSTNPSAYHFKMLKNKDPEKVKRSVYEYMRMVLGILKLDEIYTAPEYDEYDPSAGIIEMHYLSNKYFLSDNYLLKNASRINVPVYIIQGRFDMVCPPKTAYLLSKMLPNSKLIWTINGHAKQHEASSFHSFILENLSGAK